MTERENKFLSDIINSIALIREFMVTATSFAEYTKDQKTKGAVERHLGIIGEAVNKFSKETEGNEIKHAARIISLRNRLVHAYDQVDDSIIWSIITRHLTPLEKEVSDLINRH